MASLDDALTPLASSAARGLLGCSAAWSGRDDARAAERVGRPSESCANLDAELWRVARQRCARRARRVLKAHARVEEL